METTLFAHYMDESYGSEPICFKDKCLFCIHIYCTHDLHEISPNHDCKHFKEK